jgi:hypothetical protein
MLSALSLGLINIAAFKSATPPPATIPSLIAALVAQIASSTLSVFSFNSILESAPTFTVAILADNLANLFSSLITSGAVLFLFKSFLIVLTISLTSSLILSTLRIVSVSLVIDLSVNNCCSGE